ncbi:UNVERIFIED_ORG: hypothetical protein DFO49_3091 [Herbaspirillum seropedicae]
MGKVRQVCWHNGVEIAGELLGDKAGNARELRMDVFKDGDRLQDDSGEVIMEQEDVQVDTITASRMLLKFIPIHKTYVVFTDDISNGCSASRICFPTQLPH